MSNFRRSASGAMAMSMALLAVILIFAASSGAQAPSRKERREDFTWYAVNNISGPPELHYLSVANYTRLTHDECIDDCLGNPQCAVDVYYISPATIAGDCYLLNQSAVGFASGQTYKSPHDAIDGMGNHFYIGVKI